VFDVEPCEDVEFLTLPNLYCTPHTGGSAEESILAMGRSAIHHLTEHFKG
jgi:phosphoglycerate dehydrogenase-like enzyme